MSKISIIAMKIVRRILLPLQRWYRTTKFLSGLETYEQEISVGDNVNLWNDHVSIGAGTYVYPGVTLWGPGKIEIGRHVEVGLHSTIFASKFVAIKDNVLIAAGCYIIDSNHGIAPDKLILEQPSVVKGPVIIEEDAWLGAGVKVLSGVHIGRGAVIGAQSVVNRDIPDYAIAAGVPAKVIGSRKTN